MEERKRDALNILELGVGLVAGVHEVFDLGLGELPLAGQPRAGGDLVAEGLPHLRNAKRQTVGVLLATELVVEEDALGRLGSQVALQVAAGANGSREHEVELVGVAEVVARLRRLDLVLLEDRADLLLGVGVGLVPHSGELRALRLCEVGRLEFLLHDVLEELVRAEELGLVHHVLDHEVVEAVNVSRRLQHGVLHDASVLNLQQTLLNDKVLPPLPDDVVLHCTAGGAVGEEAGNTAVDVEGRPVEEAPLAELNQLLLLLCKSVRIRQLRRWLTGHGGGAAARRARGGGLLGAAAASLWGRRALEGYRLGVEPEAEVLD
mmetsp:Transcript_109663/g.291264  ORF Transcript_109663/g.291264 Transcript_109663/m.291264 type:complete len:320 (+) Transcript_109663:1258-2217(+)